ncbi:MULTISPECIES: flagellar export protein FliJ [Vibrio]|uniref:Flagellar FliJ protein n=2 Tax=Vibrio TaxID=662 RepID=A0A1E5D1W7_9VIBR|nr:MULTISPECIES: flagellar export protein FliJ [Vibrio]MDN3697847.1 flagellar export protein FliJ [Vibrio cortegadensis]NOH84891.1 flagella biosynthesis chaperone FliJ [Vibrio sp. 03-59-1]OEE77413.1 flagellar protein FliJ [Vibrio genomosp. F6 str. FF-238]TKF22654.1 flagella biosynthesis chaperone FliJ [Vibrio genomosp. F6]
MDNALDFLLEQAKEKQNQAQMALNQANIELEDYYKQVAQIEQYRLDYCQQLIERGKNGLTASQYGHLNRFLTQLDETLSKQRDAESHFKNQVDNCQEYWLEMRKQCKSYEWLMEKKETEKRQLEEKRDQKQMDEFSTLLYSRKKSHF